MHLLTAECFDVYLQHLKPGGIVAFHISNRFFDLAPVVYHLGESNKMHSILVDDDTDDGITDSSIWVLVTSDDGFAFSDVVADFGTPWEDDIEGVKWTDDFATVVPLIDWSLDWDWSWLESD